MQEITLVEALALSSPAPVTLICTANEAGTVNMAPVSFFMYSSFNPPMLAFAMGKDSHTGENIRRTKHAILTLPGASIAKEVMIFGKESGSKQNKLAVTPIPCQKIAGSDIEIPADARVALIVSLAQTMETGDHYLYLCDIHKIYGDDTKDALFAWEEFTKLAPAQVKE